MFAVFSLLYKVSLFLMWLQSFAAAEFQISKALVQLTEQICCNVVNCKRNVDTFVWLQTHQSSFLFHLVTFIEVYVHSLLSKLLYIVTGV